MKKLLFLSVLSALLVVSCSEKEGSRTAKGVFKVEMPEEINSRYDGEAFEIFITTNKNWGVQYEDGSDWFAIMPDVWTAYFDEPETVKVYLVTEASIQTTPRSGRCWIVPAGGSRVEITVSQEGAPEESL